jgi:hypothetical protein
MKSVFPLLIACPAAAVNSNRESQRVSAAWPGNWRFNRTCHALWSPNLGRNREKAVNSSGLSALNRKSAPRVGFEPTTNRLTALGGPLPRGREVQELALTLRTIYELFEWFDGPFRGVTCAIGFCVSTGTSLRTVGQVADAPFYSLETDRQWRRRVRQEPACNEAGPTT